MPVYSPTFDLGIFGIDYPKTDDIRERRAIAWKYQYDLMQSTPQPRHVLHQLETLERLEAFLGFQLGRIIVRPDAVGRWKKTTNSTVFIFLKRLCSKTAIPKA